MPMDERRRETILEDCVERLRAGEDSVECLARYRGEAATLAPLLNAAVRLQGVSDFRLTADQRIRAKQTLRAAMLGQPRRSTRLEKAAPGRFRLALPGSLRGLALAGMLVFALFVVVTITAVAASQPGDLAYPVRLIVERAPTLLQPAGAGRIVAELRLTERRLADVERYLSDTGQLENHALAALLSGDQAAADRALVIPEPERAAVAERLASHARTLAHLAETAPGAQTRERLREAAAHAFAIANRLRTGQGQPEALPGGQPTVWPHPTSAPAPATTAPAASPTVPAQRSPAGPSAPRVPGLGPQATAAAANPKATPLAPAAPAQPVVSPSPRVTTASSRPTATPYAQHQVAATPTQAADYGGTPTAAPGGSGGPGGSGEPGGSGGSPH
jgi:hypothetical protein